MLLQVDSWDMGAQHDFIVVLLWHQKLAHLGKHASHYGCDEVGHDMQLKVALLWDQQNEACTFKRPCMKQPTAPSS